MMGIPQSLMDSTPSQAGGPGMGLEMALPGLIGGAVNYFSQQNTNNMQSQIADRNNQFAANMSNTAHQREVSDLEKAGLNPILSAGGSGSSTPSMSQPNLTAPQISTPDFMAYGISMKQLEQADKKLAIDGANSASQIAKNLSDQDINKADMLLKKQGLLGREFGTDATSKLKSIFGTMMDSVKKPSLNNLKTPPSSGGEIPSPKNIDQGYNPFDASKGPMGNINNLY